MIIKDDKMATSPKNLQESRLKISVHQVQKEVDGVIDTMKENISKAIEREGKLDDLSKKTDILTEDASIFRDRGRDLRKKMWWKNVKMWIIIIMVALILIAIIVGIIYSQVKK